MLTRRKTHSNVVKKAISSQDHQASRKNGGAAETPRNKEPILFAHSQPYPHRFFGHPHPLRQIVRLHRQADQKAVKHTVGNLVCRRKNDPMPFQ